LNPRRLYQSLLRVSGLESRDDVTGAEDTLSTLSSSNPSMDKKDIKANAVGPDILDMSIDPCPSSDPTEQRIRTLLAQIKAEEKVQDMFEEWAKEKYGLRHTN
jgi:hypothetical protein